MKAFRIIVTFLLVAWMVLIFCFSAQNATESSNTSGRIITVVVRLFYSEFDELSNTDQQAFIESFQFIVRKGAHFSIYAVLGALAFMSVITYNKMLMGFRLFLSILICVMYSVGDEIHQYFVPGRSCEIRDMLIDVSGALFTILILSLVVRCKKFYVYVYGGDYMRKKELQKLYEQAYDRISRLTVELEDIKSENVKLKSKIEELEIKKEIEYTQDIIQTEPIDIIVEEKVNNIPEISSEREIGAQAIGRIIVNAAKYCNRLTDMGENKDIKELINLILGRTEVAKAEILNIVSERSSIEEMNVKINKEEAEAEDYFASVLGQIEKV